MEKNTKKEKKKGQGNKGKPTFRNWDRREEREKRRNCLFPIIRAFVKNVDGQSGQNDIEYRVTVGGIRVTKIKQNLMETKLRSSSSFIIFQDRVRFICCLEVDVKQN